MLKIGKISSLPSLTNSVPYSKFLRHNIILSDKYSLTKIIFKDMHEKKRLISDAMTNSTA